MAKHFTKALSVGLSLALCVSMVTPAFAASFDDLSSAVTSGNSVYQDGQDEASASTGAEKYKIEASKDDSGKISVKLWETVTDEESNKTSITISKDVTIDLNGNDIVDTKEGGYTIAVTGANGLLTVKDSSEKGNGKITSGDTYTLYNYSSNSTLNLEGGTIESTAEKGRGVYTKGNTTIAEGAQVESKYYGVQVTGGTTTIAEGAQVESELYGVTVNGGTLTTSGDIDGDTIGILATSGKVIVNGGEVDGRYGVRVNGAQTSLEVNGGKITGDSAGVMIEKGATATITGESTEIKGTYLPDSGLPNSAGITIWDDSKLTVEGGNIHGNGYGIAGNGQCHEGDTIILEGGKISSSDVGTAIFHPQEGTLIIGNKETGSGPEITGYTGVLMNAGELTMYGGTITSNGTDATGNKTPGQDGTLPDGSAIAIVARKDGYGATHDQDGYSQPAVNVLGGELNAQNGETCTVNAFKWDNKDGIYMSWEEAAKNAGITGGWYDKEVTQFLGMVDTTEYQTSSLEGGEKNVGCYKIEGGVLPYQVGYLTATTETPAVSMQVNGTADLPLAFCLNDVEVNGTVLTDVDWSVAEDGADIVSIANGTVTALAAGSVTITAALHNGETVTFEITVTAAPVIPDPIVAEPEPEIEIDDPDVPLAGLFTRADAIGYLWEQAGSPEWELSDFPDVPEDHQWAVAIGWAQDMGIALPDLDGNFRPDDLVLRSVEDLETSPEGELQEFLNRYAVYAGIELDEGELFIVLEGTWDDIIMGEDAQVIFDDFFARLEVALAQAA